MTLASATRNPAFYGGLVVAALAVAFAAGGAQGLAGMALGLGATGFSLIGLWYMVRLLGRSTETGQANPKASLIIVAAFFIKLPLFVILGTAAHVVGGTANPCFLSGLGLVYLCLVGWALAER